MDVNLLGLGIVANLRLELGDFLVLSYLDPGTGSLIFQVLVASLVSAGVVFGGVMSQLRSFFSRVVRRRRSEFSESGAPLSFDDTTPDVSAVNSHGEQPADDGLRTLEADRHRKAA